MQICICRVRVKEWIKISDLLFFQEGPGVRNTQYTQSGVKLLNVANLVNGKVDLSTSDRYISEDEAYGRYKHFLCDDGDFIIASSGIKVEYFDRKMGFVDSSMLPLCMNTSTIRFKVIDSKRLNIKYFMYYLKSIHFKQQLSKFITGSAQLNFGPSHLKKMNMPLVSLKEQNDIVEKLSKVELLLDKYNGEIKLLDELIKARFVEMFGDSITNDKNLKLISLFDLSVLKAGKSIKTGELSETYDDETLMYPCFGGNGIRGYINRYSHDGNYPVIGRQGAWAGNVNYATGKFYATEHAIVVTPKVDLNTVWYYYGLKYLDLTRFQTGAAQPGLAVDKLNKVFIPFPAIELQNQFASFVEEIDKSRSRIQKSLEASQELFDSLMQEYFG